jgi:Flp pilus assembly protein TadB
MAKKLAFDTLEYAIMLKKGGVEHADVHSSSLAEVITHNIYIKNEVDNMIEAALKKFEERTNKMQLEMKELEKAIHTANSKTIARLTINLGIISALLALVASVVHYVHL